MQKTLKKKEIIQNQLLSIIVVQKPYQSDFGIF